MKELCGLNLTELKDALASLGEKPFRAAQIFDWVYKKKILSFDEMKNLPKSFIEKLKKNFQFPSLKLLKTQTSEDGETIKFLWELSDKKRVESVLIFAPNRRTVCVSSQVGCPARCAFCASGKEGLIRNLTPSEIVEQVLLIDQFLREDGERVCHLVFMGMGEPFENYDAVLKSIEIFNAEEAFQISQRRITISTVGVVEKIRMLSQETRFKVNLVLSLHAPNERIRKKIIPYARKYPLEEIISAMDEYSKVSKRDITYEYTLIKGINDQIIHAKELRELLRNKQCTVNLIPYNPVQGLLLERPDREGIEAFRSCLLEGRINTTWRYTKGKDIAAACGQLALQKEGSLPILK